ncbi:uncharacterized protein LOC130557687 [Triplophysa rosa]|uniref:uncharacterized protein LOC130557687 n=1 Tax=Triplophysa rosa TaxID=992332 RepID=UPI002545D849|nr:uncharacterized protein LOC130557687 [Triplophysa rosa]
MESSFLVFVVLFPSWPLCSRWRPGSLGGNLTAVPWKHWAGWIPYRITGVSLLTILSPEYYWSSISPCIASQVLDYSHSSEYYGSSISPHIASQVLDFSHSLEFYKSSISPRIASLVLDYSHSSEYYGSSISPRIASQVLDYSHSSEFYGSSISPRIASQVLDFSHSLEFYKSSISPRIASLVLDYSHSLEFYWSSISPRISLAGFGLFSLFGVLWVEHLSPYQPRRFWIIPTLRSSTGRASLPASPRWFWIILGVLRVEFSLPADCFPGPCFSAVFCVIDILLIKVLFSRI